MKGEPCGFCVYSNVAIGALHALKNHENVKKVLIFDWDVHHGNSTYKYLKGHPDVLFISLHRYDDSNFYPGSKLAHFDNVGIDKGEGLKLNIPWSMFEKHELIGT